MPTEPTESVAPTEDPEHPAVRDRRKFVVLSCLLVGAMFLALVGILYQQWVDKPLPTALVLVAGSPATAGTELWLERAGRRQSHVAQIAAPQHAVEFFVQPGVGYDLVARTPRGELQIYPLAVLSDLDRTVVRLRAPATLPATTATAPTR